MFKEEIKLGLFLRPFELVLILIGREKRKVKQEDSVKHRVTSGLPLRRRVDKDPKRISLFGQQGRVHKKRFIERQLKGLD